MVNLLVPLQGQEIWGIYTFSEKYCLQQLLHSIRSARRSQTSTCPWQHKPHTLASLTPPFCLRLSGWLYQFIIYLQKIQVTLMSSTGLVTLFSINHLSLSDSEFLPMCLLQITVSHQQNLFHSRIICKLCYFFFNSCSLLLHSSCHLGSPMNIIFMSKKHGNAARNSTGKAKMNKQMEKSRK
jgi:hypothetical protein